MEFERYERRSGFFYVCVGRERREELDWFKENFKDSWRSSSLAEPQ